MTYPEGDAAGAVDARQPRLDEAEGAPAVALRPDPFACQSRAGTEGADADAASRARNGRGLAANLSALAASQAVTWSMTLLWTLVVPRFLGPSQMGLIVTAGSATAILSVVFGIGTRNFLVREIAAHPERAPALTGSAVVLRLLTVPLFCAAVIVYGRLAHYGPEGRWVLYLSTAASIIALLVEPAQAAFQGLERMQYLAYSDVFSKTLQSLGGIALVLLGFGVVSLTTCSLAVAGFVAVLNGLWIRPHVRMELRTSVPALRTLVRDSAAYWAFGVFYMVYLWIDSVMLGLMTPASIVGDYGVATRLFTTLMFVPGILSTGWLPRLVQAFEADPERLRVASREPLELVVVLSLPICVVTAMGAGPIMMLLYGGSYGQARVPMVFLALCIPAMYLNIMLNQVLVAANRPLVWTWVMMGATVVNPVVNLFLIRITQAQLGNGAIGAAISLLVTEVLIAGVGIVVVGRHVIDAASSWRLLRAGFSAGLMWAAMLSTQSWGIVPSSLAGLLVFSFFAVLLKVVTREQRVFAKTTLDRVVGKLTPLGRRAAPDSSTTVLEEVWEP
jgi:O-antigen/teichoic acid export membrane protein